MSAAQYRGGTRVASLRVISHACVADGVRKARRTSVAKAFVVGVRRGDAGQQFRGGATLSRGSTATEPRALLASRTVTRRLVATFLLVATFRDLLIAIRLVRLVLSAVLILFAGISVALIHEASQQWIVATSCGRN